MKTRVRHTLDVLRSTMWLIPGLMGLGSVALAALTLHLDSKVGKVTGPLAFVAGPEAAHALLATLAGATLGVVGVTFSITMVVLAMASQQLGPRLMREFLRDRLNHAVFGVFLATFLYAILLLKAISPDAPLPQFSILTALALATLALAMLLYFIHHVAHSVQADQVIARVSRELEHHIDRLYPERIGEEPEQPPEHDADPPPDAFALRAKRMGYLQAVEQERVVKLATTHDLVIRLDRRPGDFVPEGTPILRAWPADHVPEGFEKEVSRLAFIGTKRTAEQDVEFSIDQLVEVAVRSLSTGINDPFTAMRCVDHLGSALGRLCLRRLPSAYREDEDGRLRVVAPGVTFAGLMDGALDPIRQYGVGSVPVLTRLLEALEHVAECAGAYAHLRDPVEQHAQWILRDARHQEHAPWDLKDIETRHDKVRKALAAAQSRGHGKPTRQARTRATA